MADEYPPGTVPRAFEDLDEDRITPAEYARRTRREVDELIRHAPTPRRELGDDREQ
jgi:hypothetical protein